EIAAQQVAGAGWALMKPFQPRRPGAEVERKRPAAEDNFRLGEQPVALLAGAAAGAVRPQVTGSGIGRPGLAIFAVEPAAGIGQPDPGIDRLDLRPLRRTDPLDRKNVDLWHFASDAALTLRAAA